MIKIKEFQMKSTKPLFFSINDSTGIQIILKNSTKSNEMSNEERLLFELILKKMLATTFYDEEKQDGDET